ncbi:MAG: glutamine amidotransferase [Bacilli bacterium]|nr:glutamine amidotransferase [Bacilli bacterium]
MKLTIAHLYYDLLNLYGENGNVKVLKKQLENQGMNVTVKFVTVDDDLEFDKYDLVYIGAGTEQNQKIALNHLLKYKDNIKDMIENNKVFLVTGNAIDLFGKYILNKNNKKYKALGVFPYTVKEEDFRMIDEALFKFDLLNLNILGFQNQSSVIRELTHPWFNVIQGVGSYPGSSKEGIRYKNFYGTYLVGPILARNPKLLEYFIKELVNSKVNNFKFKKFDLKIEIAAYDMFMNNFYKETV